MGTVFVDLSDIYHLKVGDIIDMNKAKDKDVKLFIGRQAWFTGKMGVYKKNVAIRINRRLYEEEEEAENGGGGNPDPEAIMLEPEEESLV